MADLVWQGMLIMLVGMGVVFAMLFLLHIFMGLITSFCPPGRAEESKPGYETAAQEDLDQATVAALAVALAVAAEQAERLAASEAEVSRHDGWRLGGRFELQQGPRTVTSALKRPKVP